LIIELQAQPLKGQHKYGSIFAIPALTWGAVYFLLWCYRSVFSVIGEVVLMRLTPISDTRAYQAAELFTSLKGLENIGTGGNLGLQALATGLTELIGGLFGFVFLHNAILVNIGFQTIGFIGLVAMLRALTPRERIVLLSLLMLPSVTVWTSIASKEALLTFMLGIICAHIINIYTNKDKIRWYFWLCLFLLYAYKPHYFVPAIFVLCITYAAKYFRQKATVAMLVLIGSFALLFLFRDQISELANWTNFALSSMGGDSGRPQMLIDEYDVFYKAPYGMFISFFGPTFGEIKKLLHVLTFIESSVIIAVFIGLVIRGLWVLPIYNVVLGFGTVFWILFLSYPLGATNAGTAIRYRSGYILLIFLAIIFLSSRPLYVDWKKGLQSRLTPMREFLISKGWVKEP